MFFFYFVGLFYHFFLFVFFYIEHFNFFISESKLSIIDLDIPNIYYRLVAKPLMDHEKLLHEVVSLL